MDILTILLIVFVVAVLLGGAWRYRANEGSLSLLEVLIIVVLLVVLFGGWGIHRHYYYP